MTRMMERTAESHEHVLLPIHLHDQTSGYIGFVVNQPTVTIHIITISATI